MFLCVFFLVPLKNLHSNGDLLLVTVCNFSLILGTHGHWGGRVLKCAEAPTVTLAIYLHLRRPVTLAPVALRLKMELSLCVLYIDFWFWCGRGSNTQPTLCEEKALTDCITAEFWIFFVQIAFTQYIKTILLDGNLNFTQRMPQYSKYRFYVACLNVKVILWSSWNHFPLNI